MKFKIDKKVFEKFPTLIVAIPIIEGFNNNIKRNESVEFLRKKEKELREDMTLETLMMDKRITAYTQVFKEFGIDPETELPAHLALSKRVIEGGEIPDINSLVNLYNAFSINQITPFGGEDLEKTCGDFVLFEAKGGEPWVAIGAKKSKPAQKGELVWGDDFDLSTKALNWRQCERTKLTITSTKGYFIMDGFADINQELIKIAAEDFCQYVTKEHGGKYQILWLDKTHPEVEIDFVNKKKEDFVIVKKEKLTREKKYFFLDKKIYDLVKVPVNHPASEKFGDYAVRGDFDFNKLDFVEKVDKVAGFCNLWIKKEVLISEAESIYNGDLKKELSFIGNNKNIMVEFAHPNTHKELHIGHMRTLITGESLSRFFEFTGSTVFRANYQGDIGPHVAKAIWGVINLLKENGETVEEWDKRSNSEKAHFLGKAYILGSADYENDHKGDIDEINQKLYKKDVSVMDIYRMTRKWSLDYYDDFYKRFYTNFDKLFFESDITEAGRKVVMDNLGKIFEMGNEDAIVFDGEKYGLHKRVFITGAGTVTYEGKEMGLAYAQRSAFEYDKNIHVVGNEQTGYFQVVIKAMELIDPWFKDRQYHLPMGMVNLVGKKMSSRTGDIITVDSILDETKSEIKLLIKEDNVDKDTIAEVVTIGAVKFSVLKSDPTQNSIFDIKNSIDLSGNSGPYLQYTYARCQSVISKSQKTEFNIKNDIDFDNNELPLLRYFYIFKEKIAEATDRYSPAVLAEYLLNLARKYNEFYGKCRIIGEPEEDKRLFLTKVTSNVLKIGLGLLGIETVEKM